MLRTRAGPLASHATSDQPLIRFALHWRDAYRSSSRRPRRLSQPCEVAPAPQRQSRRWASRVLHHSSPNLWQESRWAVSGVRKFLFLQEGKEEIDAMFVEWNLLLTWYLRIAGEQHVRKKHQNIWEGWKLGHLLHRELHGRAPESNPIEDIGSTGRVHESSRLSMAKLKLNGVSNVCQTCQGDVNMPPEGQRCKLKHGRETQAIYNVCQTCQGDVNMPPEGQKCKLKTWQGDASYLSMSNMPRRRLKAKNAS